MNTRKNIDYSEMFEALDRLMEQELPQKELYCEIGKAVCKRTEKGVAVMASEYLNKHYPDVKGFSPLSLRRMRDFYRTYEKHPALLRSAMELGWIQNVVIIEAELTLELREWYMKAVKRFGWSKTELIANIAENAHENIVLAIESNMYDRTKKGKRIELPKENWSCIKSEICIVAWRMRKLWLIWKEGGRQRRIIWWKIYTKRQIAPMRY